MADSNIIDLEKERRIRALIQSLNDTVDNEPEVAEEALKWQVKQAMVDQIEISIKRNTAESDALDTLITWEL